MNTQTLNLLEGADIQFRREHRLDIALVKNLPIALIFLPAADIPTFVGEGRVDLGITGYDQVQEYDAGVQSGNRARRGSAGFGDVTVDGPPSSETAAAAPAPKKQHGCETVLDLGFGSCKLQVQVPQKGAFESPRDLIGRNVCTSFVHLAEKYFADLEKAQAAEGANGEAAAASNGQDATLTAASASPKKLRTKIIELSGSVEAACALGVADGIVDLVG